MTPAANLKTPRLALLLALTVTPLLLIGTGCGQEDGFAAEPGTETRGRR